MPKSVPREIGATPDVELVIVGAGFAGLYMLHRARQAGLTACLLEAGDGVGGTWYWNRYPGARCDIESIEYSYSFSSELQQDWTWTEVMAAQPEIEAYLNHVADRFSLRSDIRLGTAVTAATFDEDHGTWVITTATSDTIVCRYCVMATGCLSVPVDPDFDGLADFGGEVLRTSRWPKAGVDLSGRRVGVVGTGSSGVQCVPVLAQDARELVVFQRSAAFTRPANNRPMSAQELAEVKASYDELRRRQRESPSGALRVAGISLADVNPDGPRSLRESTPAERAAVTDEFGWYAPWAWADTAVDPLANEMAVEMYGELVRDVVTDPDLARSLTPTYPIGCKRPVIDTGYLPTFNRPNVHLVDLRREPIERVTRTGVRTSVRDIPLDVIVLATGFDAMTGALTRIDIRGRGGRLLRDRWREEGPMSYLGLQVAGFPNLFTVTGPNSPSVSTNMVVSIEQHVDWITDCIEYLRRNGHDTIEATAQAEAEWVDHCRSVVAGRVVTWDSCNAWSSGRNVPGKPRHYMPYAGGLPAYRAKCESVAAAGYEGFALDGSVPAPAGSYEVGSVLR